MTLILSLSKGEASNAYAEIPTMVPVADAAPKLTLPADAPIYG